VGQLPQFFKNGQRSEKNDRLRFVVPTLSTIKLWKGWGTQLYGLVKGAPPADTFCAGKINPPNHTI
jgi:hypothetical protein